MSATEYLLKVTSGPFEGMYVGEGCLTSEAEDALRFTTKKKQVSETRGPRGVPVEFVEVPS